MRFPLAGLSFWLLIGYGGDLASKGDAQKVSLQVHLGTAHEVRFLQGALLSKYPLRTVCMGDCINGKCIVCVAVIVAEFSDSEKCRCERVGIVVDVNGPVSLSISAKIGVI
ncbi:unnamed protein product [Ostreobium quekettii]|uniref:Secreted protein n=1 Tax=Ostreobium quekettii TaxID=121088 RepID=A0A8S1J304_9CHLO|nr:unnamed protein product [Ostreobium quekettii]